MTSSCHACGPATEPRAAAARGERPRRAAGGVRAIPGVRLELVIINSIPPIQSIKRPLRTLRKRCADRRGPVAGLVAEKLLRYRVMLLRLTLHQGSQTFEVQNPVTTALAMPVHSLGAWAVSGPARPWWPDGQPLIGQQDVLCECTLTSGPGPEDPRISNMKNCGPGVGNGK